MSMLLLAAISPTLAQAPVGGITAEAKSAEDCGTPHVDTDKNGVTPAEGDEACEYDFSKKKYVSRSARSLSENRKDCLRRQDCAQPYGFRHGTTTDDEIDGVHFSHEIWFTEVNEGFYIGGSPELPGLLAIDPDLDRLLQVLEEGRGEVMVAAYVPEGWGVEGFRAEVVLDEEVGNFMVIADRQQESAASIPFGETGWVEFID